MNNILIASAIAAASLLSTQAHAQAYVSGHVGVGSVSVDCAGVPCDENDTAGKLLGGFNFGNGFAVEAGYASFGKATITPVNVDIKVGGLLVGAAYHVTFSPNWGLTARVGAANLKTKLSGPGGSLSDTHVAPYFGVSGTYAVAKNVKLEAGIDVSRADFQGEKADVSALTLGVRIGF